VAYSQGAALLGSVDALHSSFPTNADEEYATQGSVTAICVCYNTSSYVRLNCKP